MKNDQTDDDVFEPYVLMDIAEDGTGVFSVIVDEERRHGLNGDRVSGDTRVARADSCVRTRRPCV